MVYRAEDFRAAIPPSEPGDILHEALMIAARVMTPGVIEQALMFGPGSTGDLLAGDDEVAALLSQAVRASLTEDRNG